MMCVVFKKNNNNKKITRYITTYFCIPLKQPMIFSNRQGRTTVTWTLDRWRWFSIGRRNRVRDFYFPVVQDVNWISLLSSWSVVCDLAIISERKKRRGRIDMLFIIWFESIGCCIILMTRTALKLNAKLDWNYNSLNIFFL